MKMEVITKDSRYFTPDITDIKIDYECEIFDNMEWKKTKFDRNFGGMDDSVDLMQSYYISNKYVRTAYLTEEIVANEGWKFYKEGTALYTSKIEDTTPYAVSVPAFKDHYRMEFDWKKKRIRVINFDKDKAFSYQTYRIIYTGYCKDVNDFRTIMKLLGI